MNHLKDEKSPYLIQHRENPVDWYPWSEEAFNKAMTENKPVFLSIGYSTCHWCHVMEKQSFTDPEVANLMNECFVNIKVDREERPDIDQIYMSVCMMLNGNGGWPLSIIMTPDKKPFFAATYIPPKGYGQKLGMTELIPLIQKAWKNEPDTYLNFAEKVVSGLAESAEKKTGSDLEGFLEEIFAINNESLERSYDEKFGGFGFRPKFPSPHNLLFLLNQYYRTSKPKYLEMVCNTLTRMRSGGIFDHLGFGFHRYSTDEKWKLPHFEKMIYDQAMLIMAYTETYAVTRDEFYKNTVEEIIEYVLRDMTDENGGFYSAEDADSEGIEGKFYLWTVDEISEVLNETEQKLVSRYFDIRREGNFKDEATSKQTELNILYKISETGKVLHHKEQDQLKIILNKLFLHRQKRVRPFRDDKILTNWNGLMIAALSRASSVLQNPGYYNAAVNSAGFILNKLVISNQLMHRYRENEASIDANLEDFAFFIYGLIQLYQVDFEVNWLKKAMELAVTMVKNFYDRESGGFYFTTGELAAKEKLILRSKEYHDGALPSGNSAALHCLILLDKLSGLPQWTEEINMTISNYITEMENYPTGYSFFLTGLDLNVNSGFELVINGKKNDPAVNECIKLIQRIYLPGFTYHYRNPENFREIEKIAEYTRHMGSPEKTSFYFCEYNRCLPPLNSLPKVKEFLLSRVPDLN